MPLHHNGVLLDIFGFSAMINVIQINYSRDIKMMIGRKPNFIEYRSEITHLIDALISLNNKSRYYSEIQTSLILTNKERLGKAILSVFLEYCKEDNNNNQEEINSSHKPLTRVSPI